MVQCVKVPAQVKTHRIAISLLGIFPYMLYCILCAPSRSVAVASIREHWLVDWHQLLCYCLLDNSVDDGRNTKLSYSSVRLRNLDSSYRRGRVFPSFDSSYQLVFMFPKPWQCRFNGHSIYPRRSLVCLHSFVSSVHVISFQYLT